MLQNLQQLMRGLLNDISTLLSLTDLPEPKLRNFPHIGHPLQVFQKIQKRLSHGLSRNSPEQLEQRLAKQYEEYLHTVNTTAGVFRDTIAAQVYDPLAPRSAQQVFVPICSHYPTGCLVDSQLPAPAATCAPYVQGMHSVMQSMVVIEL